MRTEGLLARLGLASPQARAWVVYDWANSVFITSIAQIFQVHFATVAAAGLDPAVATARYAWATAAAMLVIALIAPVLGAFADCAGLKKAMLGAFLGLGVLASAAMFWIGRGDWLFAAVLLVAGTVGYSGSLAFYDSLLPHVAAEGEIDRLSSVGFALGYLGGGLLMALNLWWIADPGRFGIADAETAMRLSFLSAAVWWLAFSLPLFRWVREPRPGITGASFGRLVGASVGRLGQTLRELRGHRQAFLMLLAFLVYNDGASTIIRVGATYGTQIGIPRGALLGSILLLNFVGVPFALLFARLAGRVGPRPAILFGLAVYVGISIFGYFVQTATHFLVLALLVGTVQGGTQALSRSLFASLIPRHKSAEFFGFYGVFDKFAGILGPMLFGLTVATTGSSRLSILALAVFFVAGAALLVAVDVPGGRRAAREAEARALAE